MTDQQQTEKPISRAMRKALTKAAGRERANICPIGGVYAAAETALLKAMHERGFIDWDGGEYDKGVPRISAAGRAAVAESSHV